MSQITPPLRSSQPAADVKGFFKAVADALQDYVTTENIPPADVPILKESFPRERLGKPDQPFDCITYHVSHGKMSQTSSVGTPRGVSIRQEQDTPQMTGYKLSTYGWWEDAVVQFRVYSKFPERADILAIWFHKFLIKYAWVYKFFEARGVKNFSYVERLEDDTEEIEQQELHRRRLFYAFRIEYLDTALVRKLDTLSIDVSNLRNVDTIVKSAT